MYSNHMTQRVFKTRTSKHCLSYSLHHIQRRKRTGNGKGKREVRMGKKGKGERNGKWDESGGCVTRVLSARGRSNKVWPQFFFGGEGV